MSDTATAAASPAPAQPQPSSSATSTPAEAAPAPVAPAAPSKASSHPAKRQREIEHKEQGRREVGTCAPAAKDACRCSHAAVQGIEGAKGAKGMFVGATCLWLVCDRFTTAVASLERLGGIGILQKWVDENPLVLADLRASHREYEQFVQEKVLTPEQAACFRSLHTCADRPGGRKYGNAGTSLDDRVKCLHAHTGTFLAGVANPIGAVAFETLAAVDTLATEEAVVPRLKAAAEAYARELAEGAAEAEKGEEVEGGEARRGLRLRRPRTAAEIGAVCDRVSGLLGIEADGTPVGVSSAKRRRKKRLN